MTPDVAIAVVIGALYFSECIVLLYANEALVEFTGSGPRVHFPSARSQLLGRLLIGLNPLLPTYAVYRVRWGSRPVTSESASATGDRTNLSSNAAALDKLSPFVAGIAVIVCVWIPLALILRGFHQILVPVVLMYAMILLLLVRLWFVRRELNLTLGSFLSHTFQCLACPPYAPNLLRRLSIATPIADDLLVIVKQHLDGLQRRDVLRELVDRVEERLNYFEADAPEYQTLSGYLSSVRSEADGTETSPQPSDPAVGVSDDCDISETGRGE